MIHSEFERIDAGLLLSDFSDAVPTPNIQRWRPLPIPGDEREVDFVDGLATLVGSGSAESRSGVAVHVYAANASMQDRAFCNVDGDLLIVPESGRLRVRTELGVLHVAPTEIAVIQRGLKFTVDLVDDHARGFVGEVYNGQFRLPELGPLGANGMADERHFAVPVAAYEDRACEFRVTWKHCGSLWDAQQSHSPYDVVAWTGDYVPYKYDLTKFQCVRIRHVGPPRSLHQHGADVSPR